MAGENSMRGEVRGLRIKIALSNYAILMVFLLIGEILNALFNLHYDALGYSVALRITKAFRPTVLAMFTFMFVIQYAFMDAVLKPLYTYFTHGTSLAKARVAAIALPWRIIIIQTIGWTVGTTAFYAIHNWTSDSGNTLFLSLLIKLSGGCIATLYVSIVNNLLMIPFKIKLNIIDIRENENDLFLRIKDYLVSLFGGLYLVAAYSYLIYYYSQAERVARITVIIPELVGVALFYLAVVVGLSFLSKYEYHKQMNFLKDRIRELLSDDADAGQRVKLLYFDEVGEFGALFNQFLDKFVALVDDVKNSSSTINGSMQDLSISSKEITSTSNEQAAAVKEVVSTMEDATSIAKGISTSISEVVRIALQTRGHVESGVRLVEDTLAKMDDIRIKNVDTIGGIRSLIDKIQSIWEIVDIINSIVDQTRIIAFNASLEASTAGEAGKNFQIVAAEIKRLADNTMESTTEIRHKISEIQKASNNLIIVSEEGSEKIRQGCTLSNQVGSVFQEILTSAEISASSSETMEGSVKIQAQSFEQILVTMKEIASGIENFVVSSRQTMNIVDGLTKLAAELEGGVKKYRTGIDVDGYLELVEEGDGDDK